MTAGQAVCERQTPECHNSRVRSTSDSQPTVRVEGKQQNAIRGLTGMVPLVGTDGKCSSQLWKSLWMNTDVRKMHSLLDTQQWQH